MARKPNYRFERAERERLKAERRAKREERKTTTNRPDETDPAAAEPETTAERQDS
jgi:hypothetical protein